MRSSVCSKHRGWKRLYSTNLSRDEQIRRGKELELELSKSRSKKALKGTSIKSEYPPSQEREDMGQSRLT